MDGDDDDEAIVGRPYGEVQRVAPKRKRFGAKRRGMFLEHLAATCNVKRSARAAGVTDRCVYQRRMKDAAFREAWGAALEQGYARLEAMLLQRAAEAAPPQVRGDLRLPDEPLDKDLALHLLREHKRGGAPGRAAPQAMRPASWAEVEAHFVKKLKALKVRIEGEGDDGGDKENGPSTIQPALNGPPPHPGSPGQGGAD